MTPVEHQIKTVDFINKQIFGDIFANAKKCPKCGEIMTDTDCKNGCPEQEFCANLCGNHHDIDDKSTGWSDNGNEPWFCDECKDEQIEAIESTRRNQKAQDRQFRGW